MVMKIVHAVHLSSSTASKFQSYMDSISGLEHNSNVLSWTEIRQSNLVKKADIIRDHRVHMMPVDCIAERKSSRHMGHKTTVSKMVEQTDSEVGLVFGRE